MARAVILTNYPPVDRAATRKDAERGRLLQAAAKASLPRPGRSVLLQPARLDLARTMRQRQAGQPHRQAWLSRYGLR